MSVNACANYDPVKVYKCMGAVTLVAAIVTLVAFLFPSQSVTLRPSQAPILTKYLVAQYSGITASIALVLTLLNVAIAKKRATSEPTSF